MQVLLPHLTLMHTSLQSSTSVHWSSMVTSHLVFCNRAIRSLHHVFGMTCHLNSALSFYFHSLFISTIIANHKPSSSSSSSIYLSLGLPLKIKVSSPQELIP